MRKFSLSLGLAAMVLGGAAYAQSASPAGGDITRAQAQQTAAQAFDRMDANSDGTINQADREARQKARFDRLDTDRNGAISYTEFSAKRDRRKASSAEAGQHRERGQRGHFGRAGSWGMRGMKAGHDGSVSKAQFVAAALQRFDQADADRSGTVTGQERQAARKAMRDQFRQQRQAS
ncbi:EF-hand domain-containing protein [Altericroceibacterium xinjiangense]|uniref:EF-hand domain-containing protein n=1 Tax=Altericroceibacterium xinjiangense TaxID=762261 RepID=UPI0013DF85BB|nr:EF-hand domain-containing protein [Altericroceibacterium xinjiangense]